MSFPDLNLLPATYLNQKRLRLRSGLRLGKDAHRKRLASGLKVCFECRRCMSHLSTAPRRLIVNADDFGRSESINLAVVRAHREGILTSASLMVNESAADQAVRLARENPKLGVGLHLTLICGAAALPPEFRASHGTRRPKPRRAWQSNSPKCKIMPLSPRGGEICAKVALTLGTFFFARRLS